jgi:poly(A) polymerase
MSDVGFYKEFLEPEVFSIISDVAESVNIEVYVIGGYVRDCFLKRGAKKDIDIVVKGNGIEFARNLANHLGIKKITTYKTFGTAMINYNDLDLEFVGARKESYNRNSRKPVVEDGSIEDDQNRRDFTINALALSLNKNDFGRLVDPFDGMEDLYFRTIRTPLNPDITFSDDPLRMMRAIRFAAQLDFIIEKNTFDAISKNKERIEIVSAERIHIELNKILQSKTPSIGFKLMFDTGMLKIILPELHDMVGVSIIAGTGHKDNFYHTLQVVDNIANKTDDLWLRWAALLHDIAKPRTKKFVRGTGWTFYAHNIVGVKMTEEIFRRLKLPLNEKMRFVQKMVELHMRPVSLVEEIVTDSAVRRMMFEAGDDIDSLMTLCEADITSKNEQKVARYLDNFQNVRKKIREIEEKDSIRNFQPPVSGEEIMEYFNLKPSREVGIIKNAIKEAILEGEIPNDYKQAKKFMINKAKELGIKAKLENKSRKPLN